MVRKRVRSRKGEVGLPFSDTFWARWRCTVSGQRNVNHKDIPSFSSSLPSTMGAVLRESVGPKSKGRSAEAHLLLKGGRGEGKALQKFLLLKEMELGGGIEMTGGKVLQG